MTIPMSMSLVYFDRSRKNVVAGGQATGIPALQYPIKVELRHDLYCRKASLVSRKFPNSPRIHTTQHLLLSLSIQSSCLGAGEEELFKFHQVLPSGYTIQETMWLSSALCGLSLVACAFAGVSDQTTTDEDGIRSIPV